MVMNTIYESTCVMVVFAGETDNMTVISCIAADGAPLLASNANCSLHERKHQVALYLCPY